MNEFQHTGHVPLKNKVQRVIWNIVYMLLFRPFGTRFFWWWRLLLLRIFGADIKRTAYVYSSCKIWAPWNIKMGKGACLGPNTICYNQALVELKEDACLSQYACICTAGHETDKKNTANSGLIIASVTMEKDTWVGMKAFIGMGVTIGEGAVVGATASVYKDVEPWTVVGGNPAKVIKKREMRSN
mgnify:CR=1 FL=1